MSSAENDDSPFDFSIFDESVGSTSLNGRSEQKPEPVVEFIPLIKTMVERGASELHVCVGSPPQLRIDGALVPLDTFTFDYADIQRLLGSALPHGFAKRLLQEGSDYFTFSIPRLGSFTAGKVVDVDKNYSIVIGLIPEVVGLKEAGLPSALLENAEVGIYLIAGRRSVSLTASLAAAVDHHNRSAHQKLLLLTDGSHPRHSNKGGLVVHVNILGKDGPDWTLAAQAQRASAPDIVVIDGFCTRSTHEYALGVARAGAVVYASCHGSRVTEVLQGWLSQWRASEQAIARTEMARLINGVAAMTLVSRGPGRSPRPVFELLLFTPEVREMLEAGRVDNIQKILKKDDPSSPHIPLESAIRKAMLLPRDRVD
jgi:twitching motility protein PilT